MDLESRRPKQLEIKRKEHYDRVYPRQQQLMKRLRPLLNKSDLVETNIEPCPYSPKDPLSDTISVEPKLNGKNRKRLRKELNVFASKKKEKKLKTSKKISQIRPDVLFGMSRWK